ncbi:MAG: ATP-binding protein [bacterium]
MAGLLASSRLVTLMGAGGAGKTRLALAVASDVLAEFPDGVWLVELAPLSDPALVPSAAAAVLGVADQGERALLTVLVESLRTRRLLLVLDNCEHLIAAASQFAEALLRSCPDVRLVATSREALGIPGETAWRVPSLSMPDAQDSAAVDHPRRYEAILLFEARAQSSRPGFAVTPGNAEAVAQICRRLDGIPLAIELAAARLNVLTPEQLDAKLDDRFRLLTGGSRGALPRQQTLRATMDWSYGLLSEPERSVLRRLSVFAGGWTLEAAEALCSTDLIQPAGVLDLLGRLVDKSLVLTDAQDGEVRYRLLETVRQYARDRLVESGDAAEARRRHRDWYGAVAEQGSAVLRGPQQKVWMERFEAEHDNFRAALEWSAVDPAGAEAGLRLAAALMWFWFIGGHWREGRVRLERALQRRGDAPEAVLPAAMQGAAFFAWRQGDNARANELGEEGLALCRRLDDKPNMALMLIWLGIAAIRAPDYDRATALFRECIDVARGLGDTWTAALATAQAGIVARHQGDCERAIALHSESLAVIRQLGDGFTIVYNLRNLGYDTLQLGDYARAEGYFREGLTWGAHAGYHQPWVTVECVEGMAQVAFEQGRHERAARLLGAVDRLFEIIGHRRSPQDQSALDGRIASTRRGLGDATFDKARADGQAMTLEQAVEYAVEPGEREQPSGHGQSGKEPHGDPLTAREREVAALVARGQTNREIAATLVISERTADAHVQNILNKLGFSSRAQIAAWSVERAHRGT